MVSKVMAGCLALAAFAIAIVAGIAAGNAPAQILVRALMAMILCYPVGLIIGVICQRVIDMHQPEQRESDDDKESDAENAQSNITATHADAVATTTEQVTSV